MKKQKIRKTIESVICIVIVLSVIICAFLFKKQIEKYAATGYLGVFIACFAATATILLPAPGIFVVLQYAQFLNPLIVIFLGALATALGEMIGYLLGRSGNELVNIDTGKRFFEWVVQKPFLATFLFSMIPLPVFDIIGICAGMAKANPFKFYIACFWGKLFKMAGYILLLKYAKDIFKDYLPASIVKN